MMRICRIGPASRLYQIMDKPISHGARLCSDEEEALAMIKKKFLSMLGGATFTSIVNALVIMTDTIVCGVFLGDTAVSAVNVVAPLYNLCVFFAMFISLGIPILYAKARGRFDKDEADRVFGTGLTVCIVGGILIFVLLTGIKSSYLRHFQLSAAMSRLAGEYYNWIRFELLLMPVAEVMFQAVFADGDEACIIAVSIVEAASNIILSILFCRTMGIAGVGLASVIAVALRFLVAMTHLFKKTNTLRLNLDFSFPVLRDDIHYALTDAGNYLFLSSFSYALNLFVLWRFGEERIIMVSVVLLVQEFLLLFDGIGAAFTPIMSVYLSENCFKGIRKLWRMASVTCVVESIAAMLLMILLSGEIPDLTGITDPELRGVASRGILFMTPSLIFTCYLYMLTSYYRLIDKVGLSVGISAMRDSLCVVPAVIAGGMIFGIEGVFIGASAGTVLAFFLSMLFVGKKYGWKNLPLLLHSREEGLKNYLFETEVNPERVTRLRDSAERALRETGVAARQVIRMMLMLEDLLMLVYEKNGHKKVSAECALTVSPEKITLIIRDNGAQLDLTDPDKSITSFRGYIVPGLLAAWCHEEHHLMAVSFNRNSFEISRQA